MPGVTGNAWGISTLAWAARALPPAADGAAAAVAAWVARGRAPERERAARDNAARLFPGLDERARARLGRAAGVAYARFVIEYLRHLGMEPDAVGRRVSFTPEPWLVDALERGRGLVMCTAHVGNWELGALALARLGRPVTVVARPQFLPSWRARVREAKETAGIRVIAPEGSTPVLAAALEAGGIVGLVVDGDGFSRGAPARVAGSPVLLPYGPAKLAARSGAVLAGGTCRRVGPDRFTGAMEPLAGTEHGPVEDLDTLHAAVAAWLERTLLAHPGGWCVFRPFFSNPVPPPVAAPPAGAPEVEARTGLCAPPPERP
jgi:KDO2-lipid IV(A) lauroyltransferase